MHQSANIDTAQPHDTEPIHDSKNQQDSTGSAWWGPLTRLTPGLHTLTPNIHNLAPRQLLYNQPKDIVQRLLPTVLNTEGNPTEGNHEAQHHHQDNPDTTPTATTCHIGTPDGWNEQHVLNNDTTPDDCPSRIAYLTTTHPNFSHIRWAEHVEEISGGKATSAAFITATTPPSSNHAHPVARIQHADGRQTWWCACITERQQHPCTVHPCPAVTVFAHTTTAQRATASTVPIQETDSTAHERT